MTTFSILPGEAAWRSRKVQYYAGDWTSIRTGCQNSSLSPSQPLQTSLPIHSSKLSYASRCRRQSGPFPLLLYPTRIRSPPTARLPPSVAKGWLRPALRPATCATNLVCRNWANG